MTERHPTRPPRHRPPGAADSPATPEPVSWVQDSRLQSWLAAEAAEARAESWEDSGAGSRTEDAERALEALFEGLTPLDPPAGFAARVLHRAGLATAPVPVTARWPRPVRWLTAAALTVCALGLALGRELAWAGLETLPNPLVSLFDLAGWVGGLLVHGVTLAATSLSAIPEWLRVAQAAAATPPVIVLGLLTVLVAAGLLHTLRAFQQTVERERTWSHA